MSRDYSLIVLRMMCNLGLSVIVSMTGVRWVYVGGDQTRHWRREEEDMAPPGPVLSLSKKKRISTQC